MAWPGEGLPGFLGRVAPLGRSSRYDLRRHSVLHPGPVAASGSLAARGRLLRLSGRAEEAERVFREALRLEPCHPAASAGLWEIQTERGGARARLIDGAVAAEPRRAVWRAWRGLWRLLRGLEGGRRDLLAAAAGGGPPGVLAAVGLAQDERRRGRLGRAVARLDEAVRRAPGEGWLRRLRAKARFDAGDRDGFIADCEAENLRDEGIGTFAYALGVSGGGYYSAALLAKAEASLIREPRAYWLYALRGDLRRAPEVRDQPGSAADFEAAIGLSRRPGWLYGHLARVLQGLGDEARARAAADEAVAREPRCGWLRTWRGEVKRKFGDLDGAAADVDAAMALDPDYELTWACRGAIRRARGLEAEARTDFQTALALEPSLDWARRELTRVL